MSSSPWTPTLLVVSATTPTSPVPSTPDPAGATAEQRELYRTAHEQVQHNMAIIKPGVTFKEYSERAWDIPAEYEANRYYLLGHGVGMTGEYPYLYHRRDYAHAGTGARSDSNCGPAARTTTFSSWTISLPASPRRALAQIAGYGMARRGSIRAGGRRYALGWS